MGSLFHYGQEGKKKRPYRDCDENSEYKKS